MEISTNDFLNDTMIRLRTLQQALDNMVRLRITDEEAIAFIKYYQETNAGKLKSIWMDDSIIKVLGNGSNSKFSGLRLYYAKYKEGVGRVGKPGGPKKDDPTIVVAITQQNGSVHTDVKGNYFDYSKPHPPNMNGGLEFPPL